MYGIIEIGGKNVELAANAATPIRMKQVFKIDLMKVFASAEADGGAETTNVMTPLAYIMNCQALKKDMTKINYDSFIEWCEGFEAMDFINASEKILDIYQGNAQTSSDSKKNSN